MPVLVENDAAACAIAERLYGAARELSSSIYIFLGVSVSVGIFLDGNLYRRNRNNAGEIGHLIVTQSGRAYICGKHGCLDRYVSLGSICERLTTGDEAESEADQIDALIEAGDPAVDAWLDEAVAPLQNAINMFELAYDPQAVVLGGNMSVSLLKRLALRLSETSSRDGTLSTKGVSRAMIGAFGRDAPVHGAAAAPLLSATYPQFEVLQKKSSTSKIGSDAYVDGPVSKAFFAQFTFGRCSLVSGLSVRSLTAGHDEIRDANRLANFAPSKAHCFRRRSRRRDIVPQIHDALAPCRASRHRNAGNSVPTPSR